MTTAGTEIRDRNADGFLTTDLQDILKVLEPSGKGLTWRLLRLEAVAREASDLDVLALERCVQTGSGSTLNWGQLTELARELKDVWNIVLAAGFSEEQVRASLDSDFPLDAVVVVQRFDSSCWEVYSRDADVLKAINTNFAVVAPIETTTS